MHDSPYDYTEYRLQRHYLILGVVCLFFFLVMAIGSVWAAATNAYGSFRYPVATAWFLGLFWSAWTLVSFWMIVAYYRESLVIEPSTITKYDIFRTKSIPLDEITEVKWKRWSSSGSVHIRDGKSKIKIHLENFTRKEREEIKSFLREFVPEEKQAGWDELVAFREKLMSRRKPVRSGRALVWRSILFIAIGALFLGVAAFRKRPEFVVTGVIVELFGFLLLWNARNRSKKNADDAAGEMNAAE